MQTNLDPEALDGCEPTEKRKTFAHPFMPLANSAKFVTMHLPQKTWAFLWVILGLAATRGFAATPNVDKGRQHWAFQQLSHPKPTRADVSERPGSEVDQFIRNSLQAKGLNLSPTADRRTLIRRATLDLTGLPPTPEEVEAFASDVTPTAYERLLDRLLASPRYGERWGRHWLDLARYADSSGFHNDLDRPYAWRYRDYVIKSFNDDTPYSRFVAEQIAGDELEGAGETGLVATGFGRNGPSNEDNMGNDKEQYRLDELDDVISTTSMVFLGLTVGCARCHDHKHDPITAEDYYRLLAIFNCTEKLGVPKEGKATGANETKQVQALVETSSKIRPTHLLRRGSLANKGPEVQPGVPAVLAGIAPTYPPAAPTERSTGRRRALAEWISDPANPLTYRVLANRIWQHHFGQGLVATPSDFGINGARPTHPELLDFLAARLIADGGRIKPLHKLIMLSATYQQSSRSHPRGLEVDPQNSLLWRMNPRRMEAEILRDSLLAVSGQLNLEMGGKGIKPRMRPELLPASQRNKWPTIVQEGPDHWRRSVYIYVKRQLLLPVLELFDSPTTTDTCAVRTASVLPTQALVLMNDEFVEDQAGYLASRALREAGNEAASAIGRLHALALSAPPSPQRLREALAFVNDREKAYLTEQSAAHPARQRALTDLAHVLMNSSEFLHIE